jgi:hypothetical protein
MMFLIAKIPTVRDRMAAANIFYFCCWDSCPGVKVMPKTRKLFIILYSTAPR